MKLVRPILITSGVFFLLVVIAGGLARTPAIQRWVVLRVAAKHPDLQLKLEGVSAGLTSLTLRGVQVEHRGVQLSFAELQVDYSLWAYFSNQRLQIGKLSAQGLLIDASQLSPRRTQAGLAAAPALAPGALAQIRLPWELSLEEIALQGRVVLPGATGQPALQGEFTLQGGQLAPGRDGEIRLQTRVTNSAPDALVTTLEAQSTLQVRESKTRTFERLSLTSLLTATGPSFPGSNQLKLVATMSRTATGEIYRVTLDTLLRGQGENGLALNAALQADGRSYTGDWALSVRSAQLELFSLGRTLPKFVAKGSGQFDFSPDKTSGTLQGELQLEASELEKFRSELSAIGPVRLKSEFDLVAEAGVIHFKKFSLGLASTQPVLELRTMGTPVYHLKHRRLEPSLLAAGEILRLKISGLPLAWVTPLCSAATISGGLLTGEMVARQGEGPEVKFMTSTPLQVAGITIARAGQTWLKNAAVKIDAEAGLSPTSLQAKIHSLSLKTPDGDSIKATLVLATALDRRTPMTIEGEFSADLATIPFPLLPAGAFKAKSSFGFNRLGDRLEILRLSAEATDPKGDLLGSVTVLRPFAYDLAQGRADTGATDEVQLARLKVGQLPMLTKPALWSDYHVSGRIGPAEAIVSAKAGEFFLRASRPISIQDFSVSQAKKSVLNQIKLQMQPVVAFTDGALTQLQSGVVTVQTGADIPLAELTMAITHADSVWRAVSTYNFDLPAWSSQPVMKGCDALSTGHASGELRAAITGVATQIEARTTFNGLIASDSGQTLPVANVSLRVDVEANGHFTVQAPVLLDRVGQRSDLNFAAEGAVDHAGISFTATLTSEHLELRDMLLLIAITGSPLAGEDAASEAAQSRALSPPAADQVPFWGGTTGQFTLNCKSVVSGQDWTMNGLNGKLIVGGDHLQLENLDATYEGESRFAAKGVLRFSGGLDPYQLTGDFSLTEFDPGRFFKALAPEHAPTLEGLCTIKGKLEGQGLNFDDTLDRTRGSFDLTGRKGIFRGLKRPTDKRSLGTKAVDLLGVFLSDKSAEKIAGGIPYYIDQLAQELGELPFDQFTIRLVRDPALNLQLENISLVSPQIHFIGSGLVTYAEGKPLLEQPLEATLSVRGRGKIEELLGKLKALDGKRDELGYAKTKEALLLGGTLGRPDPIPFFARLAKEKLEEGLPKADNHH